MAVSDKVIKVLFDSTPADTNEVTVTVPANRKWYIKTININNIHASSAANITLKLNNITKILARPVDNKKSYPYKYEYVLTAGQTVKITSSVASALNIDTIGIEEEV